MYPFRKSLLALLRLGCWLQLHLGWMRFVSSLYRFVYERKWRDLPLKTYPTMAAITSREKPDWWRADGPKQLWDACSSPQYVEAVWSGLTPKPEAGFDCDEFAIYAVHVAKASLASGVMADIITRPRVMSVMWLAGWKPNGHNVCLVECPRTGLPAQYAFIDYGALSKPCDTIDDVARLVQRLYAPGSDQLAWATFEPNLALVKATWGS